MKFKESLSAALWAAMALAAISYSHGLWSLPKDLNAGSAIELPAGPNAVLSLSPR